LFGTSSTGVKCTENSYQIVIFLIETKFGFTVREVILNHLNI
jgi:hypothetical protein